MEFADFQHILQFKCGLDMDKPILAGVSGGPDSLCLLDLLVRSGMEVVVAHFNHLLRDEAADEAQVVNQFAVERGLTCHIGELDVRKFAEENRLSLEEAARISRYRFLFEQARIFQAQAVAVAHHADDQVETILMHLLRGSGLSGLRGMPYRGLLLEMDNELPIVRPLLGMRRAEILQYCAAQGLEPVFDLSNEDTTFFRNRLRHELIPYLEGYNPRIREAVWRMGQTLAGDFQILQDVTEENWKGCLLDMNCDHVTLSHPGLTGLSTGMQRNLLRKALSQLRPALRNIDFEAVERACEFILHPTKSCEMDWISGLQMRIEGNALYIFEAGKMVLDKNWPLMSCKEIRELDISGKINLSGSWILESERLTAIDLDWERIKASSPNEVWVDEEKLQLPLLVRTQKPGDRFCPLGMGGHSMKLSDFWINVKLSKYARNLWPLVCSGEQIAWVCGYRPAGTFNIDQNTKSVIRIRLVKK